MELVDPTTMAAHPPVPAPPARWVYRDRFQMGGRRCRFCALPQDYDCPPVACLLCGTVQCYRNGPHCLVCHHGHLAGWYRSGPKQTCGRKRCHELAVAEAPRVGQVCAGHAAVTPLRLVERTVTIVEYARERIAHRDSGDGWEHWRHVEEAS